MNRFFDKNIEPRCEYCSCGYLSTDGKSVLCRKKGIVNLGFSCFSFSYDPLLRTPKAPAAAMPEFDPEEFKL